jgi:hypothetical protein
LSSTAKKGKDSGGGSSAEKRPKKGGEGDIKAAIEFWQRFIETAEDAKR